MEKGTVKWFNIDKGYGFIEQESGKDLFVHINEVNGRDLREGDRVTFEISQGAKGPCATNVSSN